MVLAAAGSAVALMALLGAGFWPLYLTVLLYISALGTILPIGTVLAIQPYGQMAGTASALIGTVQFGLGAVLGAGLSLLHDGTALPMSGLIGFAGVAALLCWRRLAAPST
jgi:DHA1 family bicyclomycin/chloramphenicol resistance-like MFS transporter